MATPRAEQRFPYGPRKLPTILAGIAFGGAGILFCHIAATGQRARLFPLPIYVSGAPVYVLAVLSFAFTAMAVVGLVIARVRGPRFLVLGDDWLEMPRKPLVRETVRVRRSEIREVRPFSFNGTHGVELFTAGGKLVVSNRLSGKDGVAAVEAWLSGE